MAKILAHFREQGAKINFRKCAYTMDHIDVLGRRVSYQRIELSSVRTEAIKKPSEPKDAAALGKWQPVVVPDFDEKWSENQRIAWQELRDALAGAHVLTTPQQGKKKRLFADASAGALEGVLTQEEARGVFCPLAYVSRRLKGAELNYSVSETELLAIVFCGPKLRCFMQGEKVEYVTDHQALSWLLKQKANEKDEETRSEEELDEVVEARSGLQVILEFIDAQKAAENREMPRWHEDLSFVQNEDGIITRFYMLKVKEAVSAYLEKCVHCRLENMPRLQRVKRTLAPLVLVRKFEIVGVDVISVSPASIRGNSKVLVLASLSSSQVRARILSDDTQWDKHLAAATYAFNTSIHGTTKVSPFHAMFDTPTPELDRDILFVSEEQAAAEVDIEGSIKRLEKLIPANAGARRAQVQRWCYVKAADSVFVPGRPVILFDPPASMGLGRKSGAQGPVWMQESQMPPIMLNNLKVELARQVTELEGRLSDEPQRTFD
ncbi:Retrovirus-related Pol polyprotein from transposon 17.6 [Porphyridium purpureum]|uniref:Retrovirus-related Pol polyprotein from transposon 17.6 n=1 Tax=Porphyridium purpureum TaxID=35688 RepID=A0A5J4YV87_PORPP|nr:Retrovirus-related Pol polyprotein from transposon 17.6 [Porphyridium purpureum]|eukprot:POR6094..scf227_4